MAPQRYESLDCSVARTLEIVGERWTLLILRDAFYGVRRFEEFQEDLGIARNILSDRLTKLVDGGVFERRLYEERPARYEYRLTAKGRDLLPLMLALAHFGDRWGNGDEPPVTYTHTDCGETMHAVSSCSSCGRELTLRSVRAHPLPDVVERRLSTH